MYAKDMKEKAKKHAAAFLAGLALGASGVAASPLNEPPQGTMTWDQQVALEQSATTPDK